MKKLYCVICGKSYLLEKTVHSIICSKCKNKDV